MADKISITHVVGNATVGGMSRHIAILVKEQKRRGHRVTVVCPSGPITKYLKEERIAYHVVAMRSLLDRAADHRIRHVLRELRPDVVHCHGIQGGWLGRLAARKLSAITVVYTEYLWTGDYHLGNRVWEEFQLRGLRLLNRYTDLTIAVSGAVRSFLISNGITRPGKVVMIPGVLEPRLLRTSCYHKPESLPRVIGAVGSLNAQRGYIGLLEALYELRLGSPHLEWRCQIIGAGPLEKMLRHRVRKYRLGGLVSIKTDVMDTIEAMRHFSCYVQNSRAESFGLTAIDAMALGVPPIVTDRGALPELVKHRQNGFVVRYGKTEELTKALNEMLTNHTLSSKIGREAQRFARHNFNCRLVAEQLENAYVKALQAHRFKREHTT